MPSVLPAAAVTAPLSPVTLADILEFQQKEIMPHTDLANELESLREEHALLEAEHSRIRELGEAALLQRVSLSSEVESKCAEVNLIQQRVEWYAEKAKDRVVVQTDLRSELSEMKSALSKARALNDKGKLASVKLGIIASLAKHRGHSKHFVVAATMAREQLFQFCSVIMHHQS